jgi:hypothetical protein
VAAVAGLAGFTSPLLMAASLGRLGGYGPAVGVLATVATAALLSAVTATRPIRGVARHGPRGRPARSSSINAGVVHALGTTSEPPGRLLRAAGERRWVMARLDRRGRHSAHPAHLAARHRSRQGLNGILIAG